MAAPSAVPISFNATASSYIAHVRLPQSLMQKLEAEGASDMSISLSEGVLSVGGESYQLDAVPEEGSFDVVREHGSKMCNVGAVRERIHIKQTLSSAGRAQIKQRTEQGERDAHGHQTASVDAPPPAAKQHLYRPCRRSLNHLHHVGPAVAYHLTGVATPLLTLPPLPGQ